MSISSSDFCVVVVFFFWMPPLWRIFFTDDEKINTFFLLFFFLFELPNVSIFRYNKGLITNANAPSISSSSSSSSFNSFFWLLSSRLRFLFQIFEEKNIWFLGDLSYFCCLFVAMSGTKKSSTVRFPFSFRGYYMRETNATRDQHSTCKKF